MNFSFPERFTQYSLWRENISLSRLNDSSLPLMFNARVQLSWTALEPLLGSFYLASWLQRAMFCFRSRTQFPSRYSSFWFAWIFYRHGNPVLWSTFRALCKFVRLVHPIQMMSKNWVLIVFEFSKKDVKNYLFLCFISKAVCHILP